MLDKLRAWLSDFFDFDRGMPIDEAIALYGPPKCVLTLNRRLKKSERTRLAKQWEELHAVFPDSAVKRGRQ